jgi:hypothetical protein
MTRAKDLDKQVAIVKAKHGAIKGTTKRSFEKLNQYRATHRPVALSKEQQEALPAEKGQINVQIYTFRRFPEEVLRMIFEWVVHLGSRNKLHRISHVR